jgi:hypothetical protein
MSELQSLSSKGGEGWGEEAVTPGGSQRPCLPPRLCPAPHPSPRAPLAGRGRKARWQCQVTQARCARGRCAPAKRRKRPRLLLLSVVPVFGRLGRRQRGPFPVYGVNTPYTSLAEFGKQHAHNRFWLDGRRATWPLQRAAFPKAALFILVGERPGCAVARRCEAD